jgi:hypothetical protein
MEFGSEERSEQPEQASELGFPGLPTRFRQRAGRREREVRVCVGGRIPWVSDLGWRRSRRRRRNGFWSVNGFWCGPGPEEAEAVPSSVSLLQLEAGGSGRQLAAVPGRWARLHTGPPHLRAKVDRVKPL